MEMIESLLSQLPPLEWSGFWLSQLFVIFGLSCDLLSFQFKERWKILLMLLFASIFWGIHFYLLGVMTASVIAFFSSIRFLVQIYSTDKRFLYFFLAVNIIILGILYAHWYDVLAFIGSSFFVVGGFQKSDKRLRWLLMLGNSFWIVHNVVIFTPVGIVAESLFLLSNIVGYWRFYWQKKI